MTLAAVRVPRAIDEVTPAWLSDALHAGGTIPAIVTIDDVDAVEVFQ
ncbi:MAG: hypothetical protein JOZ00_17220 [Mycobacterium sp.]|nr:hypothetical protein [Mycobacterium sp.]MBV8788413.1 hypothetical protein [Mycobacterium sp.]